MNENEIKQIEGLSSFGIALVVTQLFRLLFGGYLIGLDQFHYSDLESAWTVFGIYTLIALLTTLFLLGRKRPGIIGLIALSIFLIAMQSLYIIVYFSQPIPDPSWHSPLASWWATVSNYAFPILTLVFAIKVNKE